MCIVGFQRDALRFAGWEVDCELAFGAHDRAARCTMSRQNRETGVEKCGDTGSVQTRTGKGHYGCAALIDLATGTVIQVEAHLGDAGTTNVWNGPV